MQVGDFVRLTQYGEHYLPYKIWGAVVYVIDDETIDVDVFMGADVIKELTGLDYDGLPLDAPEDRWVHHKLERLPPHVLTEWVKFQLIGKEVTDG